MLSKPSTLLALLAASSAAASPLAVEVPELMARQSCPNVYVFGARETTAPAGYGTAGSVVQAIVNANPGAGSEAINYPASGSNPTYGQSVAAGTTAVCNQISSLASRCPNTKIVVVGYSQGAEIFDNALCGGGDPNQGISSTCSIAQYNIVAAIFMGDPRNRVGMPYNVGTCQAYGFDARPAGQYCGNYNSKVKSYCDAADPYCCTGNDANAHQQYARIYGSQAQSFVQSQINASGGGNGGGNNGGGNNGGGSTTTTTAAQQTTTTTASNPGQTGGGSTGGGSVPEWGQCSTANGQLCQSGLRCVFFNQYYSQCQK